MKLAEALRQAAKVNKKAKKKKTVSSESTKYCAQDNDSLIHWLILDEDTSLGDKVSQLISMLQAEDWEVE